MQEAIKYQMRLHEGEMYLGDVFLSNHPSAGGSHLPDLTVIMPVFSEGISKPIFYVASRAHHADIGGPTPGSMPPFSTHIDQEGLSVKSFRMIEKGVFLEEKLTELLVQAGELLNMISKGKLRHCPRGRSHGGGGGGAPGFF